ncbi:MAG: hypothetical protein V8R75_02680 [Oscillospiraceae bacterium]
MQQNDLMDLLMLEKKIYNSLNEVQDLTRQLAEALDRQDQVSVRMLLTMRQEPIDVIQTPRAACWNGRSPWAARMPPACGLCCKAARQPDRQSSPWRSKLPPTGVCWKKWWSRTAA